MRECGRARVLTERVLAHVYIHLFSVARPSTNRKARVTVPSDRPADADRSFACPKPRHVLELDQGASKTRCPRPREKDQQRRCSLIVHCLEFHTKLIYCRVRSVLHEHSFWLYTPIAIVLVQSLRDCRPTSAGLQLLHKVVISFALHSYDCVDLR